MELFWTVFWIVILIIPAIWLAMFLWTVVMYLIGLLFAGIFIAAGWIIDKVRGK